jgi:hypothetical protein
MRKPHLSARALIKEFQVPVVVEFILERMTNIAKSTTLLGSRNGLTCRWTRSTEQAAISCSQTKTTQKWRYVAIGISSRSSIAARSDERMFPTGNAVRSGGKALST